MLQFSPEEIQQTANELSLILITAISGPSLTFAEISTNKVQGLYIIFDEKEVLYAGKTSRTGKLRMRELAADFRSHTFNRKLLSIRMKEHGFDFVRIKNETKALWIKKGLLTEEDFIAHQSAINQHIKTKLKFKFYPVLNTEELTRLEHFAIAIYDPPFND